jgi:uroporphyrinogen-III synthase
MQPNKISILSTRPIDVRLIKNVAKQNIQIDTVSFIEIEPVDDLDIFNEIENALIQIVTVVFTSMNAVDAVASHLHDYKPDWSIYCIGNTTKKLVAEYFGEDLIAGTATDATELAEIIIEDGITNEVIFFCGDKRRNELPDLLRQNDIEVNEIEVYQTKMIQHKIGKNYNGILFFSPSAVESFFANNKLNEQTILFAIGNTTAHEIKKYSKNKIVVSDKTSKEDLVEKMIEYLLG